MERIAISGASGFIGSHLVDRFSSEQFERLGRDGVIPPNVDVIFDLAAYGNMAGHGGDAGRIYRANLMRIIEENEWVDNEKWIYISTSSVVLPVQTPYSLSKKAAEEFLKHTGKKVAIVRPFTVVGVGEQEDHLIPKLIDSCLNGTEMPFVKEPVHDFISVDDFVDALLVIKDNGLFQGEVYEVGSGKQTSNDEVRVLVEEATGKKANLQPVENMRAYDTKDWRANTERIYSLGWEAKRSLRQTVEEMVYARKNITD
jgi:nucleoside-diphosphate-sugar epimerase